MCESGSQVDLTWVPTIIGSNGTRKCDYARACTQTVRDIISLHSGDKVSPNCATRGYSRSTQVQLSATEMEGGVDSTMTSACPCKRSEGHLPEDDVRFFVYRVLLYSDGFTQYKDSQGSAGGVYMLPLNLLPEHRTSRKAVRLLGLTPPGIGTGQVI